MMTTELPATVVPIHTETDVILARQAGRALAQSLGFSAVDQARITTAISELARNIVIYGVRGAVSLREIAHGADRRGVELCFDDEGPGIADIPQAMEQGFTSGRGLGAGLPGTRRLMDEFEIQSTPGEGLHIVARKWR
jgi:serine/threonine-protein kinase RsbT